ncbi:MAG TPA: hypothetical protein VE843_00675 [Ktedonobacteraceae bacterium]|nr:hypothetical protein [Ktedonobacteraceae bacterium]
MQDSIADTAMHAASTQAASEGKLSRPQTTNKKAQQEQFVLDGKKRTLPTTIHMDPILKHQLLELAAGQKERKLASVSAVAVALIRRGISGNPDKPYGPSLEPVIQGSIAKGFTRHDNRLAALQARDTYDGAQTRHLVTNCLNFVIAILNKLEPLTDQGLFKRIIDQSEDKAREALTNRDPIFLEMVRGAHLAPGSAKEGTG